MADRALTPGQVAVLKSLQAASHEHGRLSGHMVDGRRAAWARPRLEALARRGLVERHASNLERWFVTTAGLGIDLSPSETAPEHERSGRA